MGGKTGEPGAQAHSQSPRHPRPEARAAASEPVSSQVTGVLTCLPGNRCAYLLPWLLEARDPRRMLGGRLTSDRFASGHSCTHSCLFFFFFF